MLVIAVRDRVLCAGQYYILDPDTQTKLYCGTLLDEISLKTYLIKLGIMNVKIPHSILHAKHVHDYCTFYGQCIVLPGKPRRTLCL